MTAESPVGATVTASPPRLSRSGHMPLRYREDGFEAKCSYCGEFLPLTLEFWQPINGMRRCKACWRLYHQLHEAGRRADEVIAAAKREAQRMKRAANPGMYAASSAAWKARNRERVAVYNREYRARRRELAAA